MGSDTNQQSPAVSAGVKPGKRNRRLLWILLLCLAGSAAVSFIVFRYVLVSVPRELVGTWQVVEGEYKGATFQCSWTGTGIFSMLKKGKRESSESSIRVRGKRIFLTSKHPMTKMEETLILVILKLTDDELVFRDQDQTVYNMVRIR